MAELALAAAALYGEAVENRLVVVMVDVWEMRAFLDRVRVPRTCRRQGPIAPDTGRTIVMNIQAG